MEPNILRSIIDTVHLDLSKHAVNSSNSQNRYKVKISGNTFNIQISGPRTSSLPSHDKEGFHAVFLDSGQVYFGRLEVVRPEKKFVRLKKVYYLQNVESAENDTEISLIKLGDELHAPFDEMNINVDKIIFWEKLKDEGAVASAIVQYEDQLS
jgi:hypothetical protein